MSAFLGPIHFWLYNKIGNQELLTKEIAEYASGKGWITDAGNYTKLLPPLESVIDEDNIHGWLQDQITDAETRYAELVTAILAGGRERIKDVCAVGCKFGESHALRAGNVAEVFKEFEDFFVNGMPCDRVNAVISESEEELAWKMVQDIHAQYWEEHPETYYEIRHSVMEGMLSDTPFCVRASGEREYRIEKK